MHCREEDEQAIWTWKSFAHPCFSCSLGALAASLVRSVLCGFQGLIPLPSGWVLLLVEDLEKSWILSICKTGKRKGGATFWYQLSLFTPFRMWTSLLCFPSRKRDTEKIKVVCSRISHEGWLIGNFFMLAQFSSCWGQFFQWSLLRELRLAIPIGKEPLWWPWVERVK